MSVAWILWLSRNNKVFKLQPGWHSSLLSLVFKKAWFRINHMKKFVCLKRDMVYFHSDDVKRLKTSYNHTEIKHWAPLPFSYLRWNTDGSSRGQPDPFGTGKVLQNDKDIVIFLSISNDGFKWSRTPNFVASVDLSFNYMISHRKAFTFQLDSMNCIS